MANDKLTNDILNDLIREVLQEKKIKVISPMYTNPFDSAKKADRDKISNPALSKAELEAFADADDDASDIKLDDYFLAHKGNSHAKKAFNKIKNKGKKKWKTVATSVGDAINKGLTSAAALSDIELDPQGQTKMEKPITPSAIIFKSMQTIGADPAKSNTSMGQFPEGISTACKVFFEGSTNLQERLERINQFSATMAKPAKTKPQYTNNLNNLQALPFVGTWPKVLAGIIVLDYISTLVTEVDSGAAAYFFEAFLAMLSGGRVVGKDMDAIDFRTNKGGKGSAKYVKEVGKDYIKQSESGFKKYKDEPILYIIARKRTKGGDVTKLGAAQGTSDPRQIYYLDIYTLVVAYDGHDLWIKKENEITKADKSATKFKLGGTGIIGGETPLTISLYNADNKKFSEIFNKMINAIAEDEIKALRDAMSNLYQANEKTQAYASTDDTTIGNKALEALIAAEQNILQIAAGFRQQAAPKKRAAKKITQENKSLKKLDKLIERVILEHINK